ncbi:unnamed protein product [Absidia cylindrospora]
MWWFSWRGIYSQEQMNAWKEVATAVHEKNGVVFLQLWHVGPALTPEDAASETPRLLTVDEIQSIIQDYAQAAKNAIHAGFDGVEIHSANGFLLDQFISPSNNKRSDMYDGSIENRARLALEVVEAVTKAIGDDRTAIPILSNNLKRPIPIWPTYTFVEPRLHLLGQDTFAPVEDSDENGSLNPFRSLWSGPFISAGNYTYSAKSAYDRAESSPNNLVAVGRAFVSNPDLVERFRNHWNLTPPNRDTFYSPGPEGYIDYPFYNATD